MREGHHRGLGASLVNKVTHKKMLIRPATLPISLSFLLSLPLWIETAYELSWLFILYVIIVFYS